LIRSVSSTLGGSMAVSDVPTFSRKHGPKQADLDTCVHCGLCLNACPTYRELGVEMDSPRGRVYQTVQVSAGQMEIGPSYIQHIDLCLACRGCETACPSGVPYGRMVEAARAEIEARVRRPWHIRMLRRFVFNRLLQSPFLLKLAGWGLRFYQISGLQRLLRASGILRMLKMEQMERLAPTAQTPFFFSSIGKTFPAQGQRRYRVAFLAGCIANVSFARLNEATVRVLQRNGCEVVVPAGQNCCGALHLHSGVREEACKLARNNIDVCLRGGYDAIITNAAGCGSTLKEYHELLEDDPAYAERAHEFTSRMKDVNEFLGSIELNTRMGSLPMRVTYQDSCHLAHGQKVRVQPRQLLRAVPGLELREMALPDMCCGSAGIYNVVHTDMSMAILDRKMENVNRTGAEVIATANPGCMLQLEAGAKIHGNGQRVAHVVEILDEAYRAYRPS
jgi:glycolate oxidase iron-sulfur subunit